MSWSLIAIDPGIANFAYVVMSDGAIVEWCNERLLSSKTKYTHYNLVLATRAKMNRLLQKYPNTKKVIVERQMKAKMRTIENTILAMFGENGVDLVSNTSRNCHFKFTKKMDYTGRKGFAEDLCKQAMRQFFGYRKIAKKDDLADCYLLLMYWLEK